MSLLGIPILLQRGPRPFFFLFYSLLWGNLPFHRSMQESPVGLLHCMDGVRGRSAPRIPQKGEAQALLCPAVRTPSTHSRPVLIFCPLPRDRETLEVSSLFARTLGSPQGARYLLQEPLSSGQWLMKPAWWQVLMSSPRLVFFGSVAPLLMTPTVAQALQLLPWHVSNAGLITRRLSGHIHVSFCLLIKLRFMQPLAACSCWLFRNTGFPWPDASLASTQRRVMNGP